MKVQKSQKDRQRKGHLKGCQKRYNIYRFIDMKTNQNNLQEKKTLC